MKRKFQKEETPAPHQTVRHAFRTEKRSKAIPPDDLPGLIRLDTDASPYPPSPAVIRAVQETANGSLRRAPEAGALWTLREAIARREGLPSPESVLLTAGAQAGAALAILALARTETPLAVTEDLWADYAKAAALFGKPVRRVPLTAEFSLPEELFEGQSGAALANPGAFFGREIPEEALRRLCGTTDGMVLLDERHQGYGAASGAGLLSSCPNLVILRTFSTAYALGGLRAGYVLGTPETIAALSTAQEALFPAPVGTVALAAAQAALADGGYSGRVRQKIIETREETAKRLQKQGYFVVPSRAGFFCAAHPARDARALREELFLRGIRVRCVFSQQNGWFLRCSVGTDSEMERLCYALGEAGGETLGELF